MSVNVIRRTSMTVMAAAVAVAGVVVAGRSWADQQVPALYGGTPVDVVAVAGGTTDGACTAGFAARRWSTGGLYMVTAGHCRDRLGPLGTPTGAADPVNVRGAGNTSEIIASMVGCSGGDNGCLVTSSDPSDMFAWAPDTAVPQPYVLTGAGLQPVIGTATTVSGQVVCWTGRGTGHEACATIAGSGFTDESMRVRLRIQKGSGFTLTVGDQIQRGDSGSLVYEKAIGGGVYAVGLAVFGTNTNYSGILPVSTIEQSLGVSVLTAP
jgi:hypothetical protein